jgi:methyl acetate hydrolase
MRLRTLAICSLAVAGSLAATTTAPLGTARTEALSAVLASAVSRGDVPAVVATVVDGQSVLYLRAVGTKDAKSGSPAAPDSIFRIASMTKPVTTVAAMMLHEEGKLGFDDPVAQYLPEFEHVRVLTRLSDTDATYESRPPSRPITIRHLLTHTSGIGYAFSDPRLAKLDDGKKAEAELPLLHDPGEKWTYGPNTAVLGRIVEKISGQTLDAFFQQRIFDPLGMVDTSFAVAVEKRDRVVTQHARANGALVEQPNAANLRAPVRGDGGLFSTGADYGRFLQLFLNGGRAGGDRLLSEASVRAMTSNQIGALKIERQPTTNPSLMLPFPEGAGKDTFSFGFQITERPAKHGMRRAGSYAWAGIFNTYFWVDPAQGIGAVILMQTLPFGDDKSVRVVNDFERALYRK